MKTIVEYLINNHVKNNISDFNDTISSLNDAEKCIKKLVDKYAKINSAFELLFVENYNGLKYFIGTINTYEYVIKANEAIPDKNYTTIDLKESLLTNSPFMFEAANFAYDELRMGMDKFSRIMKNISLPKFKYTTNKFERDDDFGGCILIKDLSDLDNVLHEITKAC